MHLKYSTIFTEGRDFGEYATLVAIGKELGLSETEITDALHSDVYTAKVKADIKEADELGIRGVPFFVFDRKYAVSGAQPPEQFLKVLSQSFVEWKKENPAAGLTSSESALCTPDGDCK